MVSEWFGVWMDGADPSLRTLHILVKTIELSTAPIITVLCSDLMTPLKHKKLIYTLIGVHAGLEVLSAFFGFIFSVDAQNVYHHETFYWVYVLAYASGVLLFIGQLLSESSHHYGLYRALVIILPVFFFCGLFLQYGAGVHIMWACSAVDVLMVYILYSELTQKIDTLTHLLNRRSYESRLASLRGHAVIYYLDVDEFKSVNDTFGHGVGDAVLAEVGSTIYAVFSKVGYCYRIVLGVHVLVADGKRGRDRERERHYQGHQQRERFADRVRIMFHGFRPPEWSYAATHSGGKLMSLV